MARAAGKVAKWTVMLDLGGTIHIDSGAVPGSIEALNKLRQQPVNIKFVTNTSKESGNRLFNRLIGIGFDIKRSELYTCLHAARLVVDAKKLTPYLLVADEALEDFDGVPSSGPYDSVVIGMAPDKLDYSRLNKAFNVLLENPQADLLALHMSKYYKYGEGFNMGLGSFATALEYCSDVKPQLIGKPLPAFFKNSLAEFGDVDMNKAFMVGDDVRIDIRGAQEIGAKGILVQTGKYRSGDETKISPNPWKVVPNFDTAVEQITKYIAEKENM